jgi:hypothetical protein
MKNKKLFLMLIIGMFLINILSFISAAGFQANTTTFWIHNESDSSFSAYHQLRNTSTDHTMITSANISTDNPIPAMRCWVNNWTSPNFTVVTSISGIWNFSLNFSRSGATTAYLFAQIFKLNSTGRFNIGNSSQSVNVGGQTTNTAVLWNYTLASSSQDSSICCLPSNIYRLA